MKVLNRDDMTHRHTVQTQLGRGLHASAGTLRRAALVAVIAGAVLSAPAQAASVPDGLVSSGGASACASPGAMIGTAGDDTIIGTPGPDTICGLGGNDVLIGYQGDDILVGGPGNDTLRGARDNDQLFGDDGNDTLFPGPYGGIDDLQGGLGNDTANYNYVNAVTITLNDIANDGELGETDNVHSDVENVVGGPGNDTITGNELANRLTGGLGQDVLSSLGGDDFLDSLDGAVDQVTCGAGADTVSSDPEDIVSFDCDRPPRPPVLDHTCTGPFAATFAFTINTIDAVPAGKTWSVTASLSASPRNLTVSSSSSFVQGTSAGPTRVNLTTPTGIPAETTVTLTPSNYVVPTSGSNSLKLDGYGGSTAASFSTSNQPC